MRREGHAAGGNHGGRQGRDHLGLAAKDFRAALGGNEYKKLFSATFPAKKQSVFATSAVAAPADSALHVDSDAPRAGPADGGGGVAQGLLLDQLGVRLHLPQRAAPQAAADAACAHRHSPS